MLLNNYWVKEETPKYLKASENTAYQNLWDAAERILRDGGKSDGDGRKKLIFTVEREN